MMKTDFNGDIRRFAPKTEPWTLEALAGLIRKSYGLPDEWPFSLRYVDGDGELVSLTGADDFSEAIECALETGRSKANGARPVLRVVVTDTNKQDSRQDVQAQDPKAAKRLAKEKKYERQFQLLKEVVSQMIPGGASVQNLDSAFEKVEIRKELFERAEKLAGARRMVVVLGLSAIKVEILSLGTGQGVFLRALPQEHARFSGAGRVRIVKGPISEAGSGTPDPPEEFVVDFNGGFGKWASFSVNMLEDGTVTFENVTTKRFLALSCLNELKASGTPFAFSLRTEDGAADAQLSKMQPLSLDAGLRLAKDMLGKRGRALKPHTPPSHESKRISAETTVLLGSTRCKLLKLENGNVCIAPIDADSALGGSNVRMRAEGVLDFRGRRGKWAQFEPRTTAAGLCLYHPATNRFLGSSTDGTLVSVVLPHAFDPVRLDFDIGTSKPADAHIDENIDKKADKARCTDAKPVLVQLGPVRAVLTKLARTDEAFAIRVVTPVLGKGNVCFKPSKATGIDCAPPDLLYSGGSGKWATFRAEAAPFEQVYLINDATGFFLGLNRDETQLAPCDGYKFSLKTSDGTPISAAMLRARLSPPSAGSGSDWEEVTVEAPASE